MVNRRTDTEGFDMSKLLYTPGPASIGKEEEIIAAGATGVRLTFSYSTPQYQLRRAAVHHDIAKRLECDFQVVADLAGEKFRLGEFDGPATMPVSAGEEFRLIYGLSSDPVGSRVFTVTNQSFFLGVQAGALITVGDGSAIFEVKEAAADIVTLTVATGGSVNQSRGLTVQGSRFRPRCLTDKDRTDLEFIAASGTFDAVALSFVAERADIDQARRTLASAAKPIPIIAKVETATGVENVADICKATDAVMAARGDLALAVPWVELPGAVMKIEEAALASNTPWILATQVVEGLERFALPTRAEICDLAHWMGRGCSGVLLSYETAFGADPIGAVEATRRLIDRWSLKDA
jgi:pyruvate kinase